MATINELVAKFTGNASGLKSAMNEVKSGLKGIKEEAKSSSKIVAGAFDAQGRSAEKYRSKLFDLEKRQEVQLKTVKRAQEEYDRMADTYGEASDQARNAKNSLDIQVAGFQSLEKEINESREALRKFNFEQDVQSTATHKLGQGFQDLGGKIGTVSDKARSIGGSLTKYVTAPVAGLATVLGGTALKKGFDRLMSIDQAQAKLKGLGHDAKSVETIMNSATESVTGTAFGLGEAATTAANAVAAGIEPGKELTRYLSLTGDAAAIAGTDMNEMGSIFNKVQTNNKIQAEEMNQLLDRGVPIIQLLAEEMNVAENEVRDMAAAGEISAEDFLNAIEGGFGGAAQIMGETSFQAALDNMWASVGRIGANFLDAGGKGGGFFSQMKPLIGELTELFKGMEEKAADWGVTFGNAFAKLVEWIIAFIGKIKNLDAWQQKLLGIGAAIAVGIGPALVALGMFGGFVGNVVSGIGSLLTSFSKFGVKTGLLTKTLDSGAKKVGLLSRVFGPLLNVVTKFAGPVGIVIGVLTALGTAFVIAYRKSETFRNFVDGLKAKFLDASKEIIAFKDKVVGVFNAIVSMFKGDWAGGINILQSLGFSDEQILWIENLVLSIQYQFHQLKESLKSAFSSISNFFGEMIGKLNDFWKSDGEQLGNAIINVFNIIKTVVLFALRVIFTTIKTILPQVITQFKITFNLVKTIVTTVWNVIKAIISNGLDVILGLVKVFSGIFTGDWKKVFEGVRQVFEGAIGLFADLTRALMRGILNVVILIAQSIINRFKMLWSFVVGIFKGIFGDVTGVWNGLKDRVMQIISDLIAIAVFKFQQFRGNILRIFFIIRYKIAEIWNAIKTTVVNVSTQLWTSVSGIFNSIRTTIVNIFNGIKEVALTVWNFIYGIISGVAIKIYNTLSRWFTALANVLGTIFNGIKATVQFVWNAIAYIIEFTVRLIYTVVKTIFTAVWNTVKTIFNAIKNFLTTVWNFIYNKIKTVVTQVWQVVSQIFTSLKNTVVNIFNAIKNVVITVWNFIYTKIKNVVTTIWNTVKTIFTQLYNTVSTIFNNLRNRVVQIWTNVYNRIKTIVLNIYNNVSTRFNSLRERVVSLFNNLRNRAVEIWTNIYNRLKQIVLNLWTAITTRVLNIKNRVVTLFNQLREGVINRVSRMYNSVTTYFKNLWTNLTNRVLNIKNNLVNRFNEIKDGLTGIAEDIWSAVKGTFNNMKDGLEEIIDNIKGTIDDMVDKTKSGINKLIEGINWVADKIGMDKLPELSTGTQKINRQVSTTYDGKLKRDTMAIVGDKGKGNGPNGFRHEMIRYPNGKLALTPNRDTATYLPKGSSVINGNDTYNYMNSLPRFSIGTRLKGFGEAVGNKAREVGQSVKAAGAKAMEKVGDVFDYVKNPGKLVDLVFKNFGFNFDFAKGSLIKDLLSSAYGKIKSSVKDLFTSWLDMGGSGGDGSSFTKFKVTTPYSPNRPVPGYPRNINNGHHYGIDYATPSGTTLTAPTDGTLKQLRDVGGGIVARLINGQFTQFFMHLSSVLGSGKIKQGEPFARTGNSGKWTTGAHLHYQVEKGHSAYVTNRNTVDPNQFLRGISGGAGAATGSFRTHIAKALQLNGLPVTQPYINAWSKQIQTESGGNPRAIQQIRDINSGGNEARGLVQVIPPTFNAYKLPGMNDIFNPLHNLAAGINYAKNRYGKSGMLNRIGKGIGYAVGGVTDGNAGMAWLDEEGFRETIISHNPAHKQRSYELWQYTGEHLGFTNRNEEIKLLRQEVELLTEIARNTSDTADNTDIIKDKEYNINIDEFERARNRRKDRTQKPKRP